MKANAKEPKGRNPLLALRVPRDLLAVLGEVAGKRAVSRQQVILEALRDHLNYDDPAARHTTAA